MHNILYLDVFTEDTSYIIRGKKHYRTWIGVFLSLLIIIASVVFTFMFGQEVYERKKPSVSNSEEFLLNSRVEMTDYPIYMFITDHRGRKIENIRDYYEINTFKMSITEDNKIGQAGFTPQHAVVRCQARHFSAIRGKISDIEIEQILAAFSYCIDYDKDGFVQNPHTSRNSTFLNIEFNICNKTANTCAEDLDALVKEAYIQLFYIDSYIDSNDYNNPVKYYYYNHNTQVSDSFFKRNFISIGNNEYLSDDGWIIESIRTIKYFSLSKIKFEINSMSPNDPLLILMTTFSSPNIRVKSNRTYMKIQDLFAKIGGIVNAFMIAVSIVFSHYFRFNFNMNLRRHLNPSDKNYRERRISNLLNMSINNEIKNNFASKNESHNVKIEEKELYIEQNKKEAIKVNESSNNNFTRTNDYNINADVNKGLLLKSLNNNINNNNINNNINLKNALTQEQILSNNYIKPLQQFKNYENNNNENKLSVRYKTLGNESKENTHSDISESDSSTFHFQYIDFTGLNYFKYLYSKIFCTKEHKKYKVIKKEIESLLDFFVYCNYLKHQYLLKDPRELKE